MNQAEGVRYKNRIRLASIAIFAIGSVLGIYLFLRHSAAASASVFITTSGMSETLPGAMMVVMPFALMASYGCYSILNFIFMRNPGYVLQEGCYSDTSWLNLNDNQLVLLDQDSILTADFDTSQADNISETYQNDSSCQDLLYVLNSQQLRRLPIAHIDSLVSDKDDRFIDIRSGDEVLTLCFTNTGTKAHALQYITARLPVTMREKEIEKAGIKSAIPQLLIFALFAIGSFTANQSSLAIVIALPVVFLLPSFLERAFGSAQTTAWLVDELQATTQQHADETPAHRQAA